MVFKMCGVRIAVGHGPTYLIFAANFLITSKEIWDGTVFIPGPLRPPLTEIHYSPILLPSTPNRRAAARYSALASIIPGRERFSWNLSL